MPLAKPAAEQPRYIKALIWGEAGSRKTRLALSFPAPLVIDIEKGTRHYAAEFGHWLATPGTEPGDTGINEVETVSTIIKEIRDGQYPDRQTLVIDPATLWLDQLERVLIKRIGADPASLSGMKKAEAYHRLNKQFEGVIMDILALPMNVVFVARDKNVWGKNGDGQMAPVGKTFAGKDSIEWLVDIVVRMKKDGNAEIQKCRLAELPQEAKLIKATDLAALLGAPPPPSAISEPLARPTTSTPADAEPAAAPEPKTSPAGLKSINSAREKAKMDPDKLVALVAKMFNGRSPRALTEEETDQVCAKLDELAPVSA